MKFHIYDYSNMNYTAIIFYKSLADETRLAILLLIFQEDELCVCELSEALQAIQPKISRHLAQLRDNQLVQDRREGQWIYYRLHENLPEWMQQVIQMTAKENQTLLEPLHKRLTLMGENRPSRQQQCC